MKIGWQHVDRVELRGLEPFDALIFPGDWFRCAGAQNSPEKMDVIDSVRQFQKRLICNVQGQDIRSELFADFTPETRGQTFSRFGLAAGELLVPGEFRAWRTSTDQDFRTSADNCSADGTYCFSHDVFFVPLFCPGKNYNAKILTIKMRS